MSKYTLVAKGSRWKILTYTHNNKAPKLIVVRTKDNNGRWWESYCTTIKEALDRCTDIYE